ncbi:MAG: PilZ domain-containing protein [Pseudomonadota bacterium]
MLEKRKEKRKNLLYYLPVVDRNTGEQMGHLVDITRNGMMLISKEPIEKGLMFQIKIELQAIVSGHTQLEFDVESRWNSRDVNPDFFDTGFRFMNIDARTTGLIEGLISEHGFPE